MLDLTQFTPAQLEKMRLKCEEFNRLHPFRFDDEDPINFESEPSDPSASSNVK